MLVPGMRSRTLVPSSALPFVLAAIAISGTILGWAIFAARPTSPEFTATVLPDANPARVRAVAYLVPENGTDTIYLKAIDSDAPPRFLTSFPRIFPGVSLHVRGSATPAGDRLAVLSIDGPAAAGARLTLIDVYSGDAMVFAGPYDDLSTFAWSATGDRLAVVSSTRPDNFGRVSATVSEVNLEKNVASAVATFRDVFQAAPVGYSIDGRRLFVVVLDQAGSALWVVERGKTSRLTGLSAGKTKDWQLSPDGARLAFIEIQGAGDVAYSGRVLQIATGSVRSIPSRQDQFGAAFRPGSEIPIFGGPGGGLTFTTANAADYAVPISWSPDGTVLAATVFARQSADEDALLAQTLEVVTENQRHLLSSAPGGRFIGWVQTDAADNGDPASPGNEG